MRSKQPIAAYVLGVVFLSLLPLACTPEDIKMNRDEIHRSMRGVLTAAAAKEEWTAALDASQAFSAAGHPTRIVFKRINQIEDLEPSEFAVEEGSVAIVIVRDEVFVWDPIDNTNVDAFFLE